MTQQASTNRSVADLQLFSSLEAKDWEDAYEQTMNPKYKKNTRNFSKVAHGIPSDRPHIFVIPRVRGGSSYKETKCADQYGNVVDNNTIQYCPISKGYSMQNVSSFTLGPVYGQGLCVVNSAFSKAICVHHIAGGVVDLKRKNFWKPKKSRSITVVDADNMLVDNKPVGIRDWLTTNRELYYDEWNKWRMSVALCSEGSFHWTDSSPILSFVNPELELCDFVEWKQLCYIGPAIPLIKQTHEYFFMKTLYEKGISLGLVHPKGRDGIETEVTKDMLEDMFKSEHEMCCMPYVVAYVLMTTNK
jgi:hypothetical protein